jgi:ketosteroid isomerase-like protein
MKKILLSISVIAAIIALTSCGNKKQKEQDTSTTTATSIVSQTTTMDVEKIKQELLNLDMEFSNYSEKNGMKEAFINYIADDGVMLRPNHRPIAGKDSATILLNKNKNNKAQMKWTPLFADVASSGDIGYTYGTYTSTTTIGSGQVSVSGTYVTIWKKNKEGIWKFVLDSGNEGLIPKNKQGQQQPIKFNKKGQ